MTRSPFDQLTAFEEFKDQVARSLDAPEDGILFAGNCTQALEVALTSLPYREGDLIVTSHVEHQAVMRPVQSLVRLRGVKHRRVPYHPGTPFDLEAFAHMLSSERVRLLVISAASNVTGEVLPVAQAAELAHQAGALVCVDAAQTFGLLPVSVADMGADLLTFAAHKYPLGTVGVGGLWFSSSVRFDCSSAVCSVPQLPPSTRHPSTGPRPSFCDVGSVNMAALGALSAGLRWMPQGRQQAMDRARRLARHFAEEARSLDGVTVFGYRGSEQTATLSLLHDRLPVEAAEQRFAQAGISIRAGNHCAPEALSAVGAPTGTVRISFGPHNTESDARQALRCLFDLR